MMRFGCPGPGLLIINIIILYKIMYKTECGNIAKIEVSDVSYPRDNLQDLSVVPDSEVVV